MWLLVSKKSCLSEHKASKCPTLGCYGNNRSYSKFPRELKVNLHGRSLANNAGRWSRVRLDSAESDEEEDDEEDNADEESGDVEEADEDESDEEEEEAGE